MSQNESFRNRLRGSASERALTAKKSREALAHALAHKMLDQLLEHGSFNIERVADDYPIAYHLNAEDEAYLSGKDYRVLSMPRSFLDDVQDGVAKHWAYVRNVETHPNKIVERACAILSESLALAFASRVPSTHEIFANYAEVRHVKDGKLHHPESAATGEIAIFFPFDYDDTAARGIEDSPPDESDELTDEDLAMLTPRERENLESYKLNEDGERDSAFERTQSAHDELFYLDLRELAPTIHDAIDASQLRENLRTQRMQSGRTH